MKKTLLGAFALLLASLTVGFILKGASAETPPAAETVKWHSFEEAAALAKKKPKKLMIDVYTDWCGWCKVMDKKTFNDPLIAKYLNENYYPVKLDGEGKKEIVFDGRTFKFVASGRNGYHELAAALMNNQMSYPTVVFLNEKMEIIQPLPGYQEKDAFHKIITFMGGDFYKKQSWEEYGKAYKSPY